MTYAIGILVILLSIVGYQYTNELTAHAKTTVLLEQSKVTINAIKESVTQMGIDQKKLSEQSLKANLELRETKRKLDTMRGRQSAYIAKPRIVEKLINKDFLKDEKEVACLTGDVAVCQ